MVQYILVRRGLFLSLMGWPTFLDISWTTNCVQNVLHKQTTKQEIAICVFYLVQTTKEIGRGNREREREKGGAVFLNKTALRAVIIDSIRLLYEHEKAPHLLTHCTWQEILGQKRHNIEIANGGVETRTSGIYVEVGKQGRSICGISMFICYSQYCVFCKPVFPHQLDSNQ